jgi:hypothetical protein
MVLLQEQADFPTPVRALEPRRSGIASPLQESVSNDRS